MWISMKSASLWRECFIIGLAVLGIVSSVLTISGLSLYDLLDDAGWMGRLSIVSAVYLVIVIMSLYVKIYALKSGFKTKIRGVQFEIKQGDIFASSGWKVIPFNEYFDTQADNLVISESSLNGQLVLKLRREGSLDDLKYAITHDRNSPLLGQEKSGNRIKYPLGCIKQYERYMLLSFSHFNAQNEAHLTWAEYEGCLRNMWREICRIYADIPIYLPLLGSGITRIEGNMQKSDFDLLKCMLCTFRSSDIQLNKPITILLTEDAMKKINLYDLKGIL